MHVAELNRKMTQLAKGYKVCRSVLSLDDIPDSGTVRVFREKNWRNTGAVVGKDPVQNQVLIRLNGTNRVFPYSPGQIKLVVSQKSDLNQSVNEHFMLPEMIPEPSKEAVPLPSKDDFAPLKSEKESKVVVATKAKGKSNSRIGAVGGSLKKKGDSEAAGPKGVTDR